jgi:hypothetical protein
LRLVLLVHHHVRLHEHHRRVLIPTNLQHALWLTLSNVKVQKLLPQVQLLATILDALTILINLKEEKHVMLVNLAVILLNEVVDLLLDLSDLLRGARLLSLCFKRISRHCGKSLLLVSLLVFDLCLDALLLVEVALEQSVVQVDLSQGLDTSCCDSAIFLL